MERVTCFPNEGTPEVIPGEPQLGDIVRSGTAYFRYTPPSEPETTPIPLSKLEFVDLAQSAGGMTNEMLVAANESVALKALWLKFSIHGGNVVKTHSLVTTGLGALDALGYIPNGAAAVLAAWPEA
ncbi:hypothetical protein UFOVP823_23 [uncultured Caudovirales phage]|uniref:Uncharacterized protein n=1 Tax=uncultured Caudovirales phage TaxID=2100421 RepID=A0A6J5P5N0_9CAUD|nr:hypothetical protein UFOVP823_23 [uncultured Caudovirales phage]